MRGLGMGMGMGDFGSNGNMLSPLPAVHTLNPAARATPPDNVFLASEVVRPEPPVPKRPVRAGAPTAGDVHPPGDVARTSPPAPVTSRVATRVHDLQSKVAALTHKLQHATAEANQNGECWCAWPPCVAGALAFSPPEVVCVWLPALQASAARDALHYVRGRRCWCVCCRACLLKLEEFCLILLLVCAHATTNVVLRHTNVKGGGSCNGGVTVIRTEGSADLVSIDRHKAALRCVGSTVAVD